jgi:hypothetical protein
MAYACAVCFDGLHAGPAHADVSTTPLAIARLGPLPLDGARLNPE